MSFFLRGLSHYYFFLISSLLPFGVLFHFYHHWYNVAFFYSGVWAAWVWHRMYGQRRDYL